MNKNTLHIQYNGGKNALAQVKSITAVTIKDKCENERNVSIALDFYAA